MIHKYCRLYLINHVILQYSGVYQPNFDGNLSYIKKIAKMEQDFVDLGRSNEQLTIRARQ